MSWNSISNPPNNEGKYLIVFKNESGWRFVEIGWWEVIKMKNGQMKGFWRPKINHKTRWMTHWCDIPKMPIEENVAVKKEEQEWKAEWCD